MIAMTNAPPGPSRTAASLIDGITDWLMRCALEGADVTEILEGCCKRLRALGYPIWRARFTFRTLHPLYEASSVTWRWDGATERVNFPYSEGVMSEFRQSPYYALQENRLDALRRRLVGDTAMVDFPVLEEFRDQGGTDYYGFRIPFDPDNRAGIMGSWIADRATGFSDAELADLNHIQRYLAVACKMRMEAEIAENVAVTYLGSRPGQKVLQGHITRGDAESIRGAIWYSDLRNSTALSEQLDPAEFLELLNCYFETTAGSVIAEGGEVLLLIGDAVLAIFPVAGETELETACGCAVRAARRAHVAAVEANKELAPRLGEPLAYGVGLHIGEFLLGNIGVPDRLEFTAIGPAINEVARLESLTKETGNPVIASGPFAALCGDQFSIVGEQVLRGFGRKTQIYSLNR